LSCYLQKIMEIELGIIGVSTQHLNRTALNIMVKWRDWGKMDKPSNSPENTLSIFWRAGEMKNRSSMSPLSIIFSLYRDSNEVLKQPNGRKRILKWFNLLTEKFDVRRSWAVRRTILSSTSSLSFRANQCVRKCFASITTPPKYLHIYSRKSLFLAQITKINSQWFKYSKTILRTHGIPCLSIFPTWEHEIQRTPNRLCIVGGWMNSGGFRSNQKAPLESIGKILKIL
jgi:hypothetical protein